MASTTMYRGETLRLAGVVARGGAPVDVLTPGMRLEFYAKRSHLDADADAIVRKDGAVTPAVQAYGGVVLAAAGAYTVQLAAADTLGLTRNELLAYIVRLTEPDATVTVVDHGTLRVRIA